MADFMSITTSVSHMDDICKSAVSERSISASNLLYVEGGRLIESGLEHALHRPAEGNGRYTLAPDYISGKFKGNPGPYQLKLVIQTPLVSANGITVHYRINNWSAIRYLAIGHTINGDKQFRHVKISNPSQDEWVTLSLSYNDLAYGLQNDWERPEPTCIKDIRIYISGTPSGDGAEIDLSWASTWLEEGDEISVNSIHTPNYNLVSELKTYFKKCNPRYADQVEEFLDTGFCPMTGEIKLNWDIKTPMPVDLVKSVTYRYLWHAMQPAISMMIYGLDNQKIAPIFAARDYINDWLDRSFFNADPDIKYAWYDHGTAERLMALILMHEIGLLYEFDYRFMSRLRTAIIQHGQLLESEVFYSYHQPTRYHNHAWFQDMALITAAVAIPQLKCSRRWLIRAIERLNDQLSNLIVRDGGYAIFVENSIGYHHGVQRLIEFAGKLVNLSGEETLIPRIAEELNAWSCFLRYPDGRMPSHGDTFRKPNHMTAQKVVVSGEIYPTPCVTILPKAGYGVVKGNHDGLPFMLCMFSTSLCETHKHEDNLSLTLFYDDIEWLVDPSFCSHNYEEEIPAYLRSAEAHNNVWIPGVNYSKKPGLSSISGFTNSDEYVIEGSHRSYDDLIVHRRVQGQLNNLNISIFDRLESEKISEDVTAWIVFHAGEGVCIRVAEDYIELNHPASTYNLLIRSTQKNVRIVGNDNEVGYKASVSGAGFDEIISTQTLLLKFHVDEVNRTDISIRKIGD